MKKRWIPWLLAALALVCVAVVAFPVLAQSTGGSFGGGSFGGGGGGGFSGGGGGGSFGGSYGGSYGGGGGSLSGGGSCLGTLLMIAIWVVIFLVKHYMRGGNLNNLTGTGGGVSNNHGARGWGNVDVSAIRLGIDWRARRELQAELQRMAASGNTNSKQGLSRLLREAILAVRRCEVSWLYCSIANYHPMSAASAEGIFRQTATSSRAKFTEELVRNADGSTSTREAAARRAHKHEGEGVVVVTLIVASRREILDVTETGDANRIKVLLDEMVMSANPQSLVAMEVVWSPADENDRMSTAELEQHYPELRKIDERSIAGRIFCDYCRGPYAMELLTCPHCGAPAPKTGQPRA
ncbi:MAG: DUF1517 domain-containing protein [Sandaracinaceae bacterium]